jgi:hypothetical protein
MVTPAERDFATSTYRLAGRNNALWYDSIRIAQKNNFSHAQIEEYVERRSHVIEAEFGVGPLPYCEIQSITRSVCNYANRGYPYMRRTKAAIAKRKRCNPNSVSARAKALGMSKSSFYSKRLHTIQGAVKHASSSGLDTTTEMDTGIGASDHCQATLAPHLQAFIGQFQPSLPRQHLEHTCPQT